jgi:hypothetical protein
MRKETTSTKEQAMFKVITKSGFSVEYARFSGDSCECVGYGSASLYDYRRAENIAKMLRNTGTRCSVVQA